MTFVVDASFIVAALVDDGPVGRWADRQLGSEPLAGPHLLPAEVTSALRRSVMSQRIGVDAASLAHAELGDIDIQLFAFAPFSDRVWDLRLTCRPTTRGTSRWPRSWTPRCSRSIGGWQLPTARAASSGFPVESGMPAPV